MPLFRRRSFRLLAALLLVGACFVSFEACASHLPNRDPIGEMFPSVTGEALNGPEVNIPEDFRGKPVVLLVGYVQDAQFDADRWLLGLMQAKLDVEIREVPTIEGLMPGMFAGTIDNGMRKGIPEEDWPSVVTVYGDAGDIVDLTGNTTPRNIRVLLLDRDGRVAWFHDRGYSAGSLLKMKAALEKLR